MSWTGPELTTELGRRTTARDRVLAALQAAGPRGLTNVDLNQICYRYGARIEELRKAGERIEKEWKDKGVWRYWLVPQDRLF